MKRWWMVLCLFGATACGMGICAEAAPAAAEVADKGSWMVYFLSLDPFWSVMVKLVGTGAGFLFGLKWFRELMMASMIEDLKTGVIEVFQNFYPEVKAAAGDGKITKAEAESLRNKAIEIAKAEMWAPVKLFAMAVGQKYLSAVVERIVSAFKSKDKAPAAEPVAEPVAPAAP